MKGMKKAISAVLTVLTTASLALTVYAADYTPVRNVPNISAGSAPTAATSTVEDVKSALNGIVTADGISDSVTVKSVASLPISSSVIKALKASGNTVLTIVSPRATISIDASTITTVRKVDLSAKIYSSTKRAVVDFRATAKKSFGCEVKITLTNCKMSAAKLANAHLYRDGEDLGAVELNEAGQPVITVTTGGTYEIK